MTAGGIGFGNIKGKPMKYDHVKSKIFKPTMSILKKYGNNKQLSQVNKRGGSFVQSATTSRDLTLSTGRD